jgi:hypothetical protein
MLYAENLEVRNFILAVEKMRWYQRDYIQTRNKITLIRCKDLEREVDHYVEQLKAKI